MATPELARALCAKADEIKQPAIHAIAAEALAATSPLPAEAGATLLDQIRRGWQDRNPWPLRLRLVLALQAIRLDAADAWLDLAALVNETLTEKRSPSAWSSDELHQVQSAAREFARRAYPQ